VIDVRKQKKRQFVGAWWHKSMNQAYHGLWKSQEALEDFFATLSISLE
jgi:hypothetical protein